MIDNRGQFVGKVVKDDKGREVTDAKGNVVVRDSKGDIVTVDQKGSLVKDAKGQVVKNADECTIKDSTGHVARDARGNVIIKNSSGKVIIDADEEFSKINTESYQETDGEDVFIDEDGEFVQEEDLDEENDEIITQQKIV